MDVTYDVIITNLPRDINDVVIRNLFRSIGNIIKVIILDDKIQGNYKLCYVGFKSMDECKEAVKLADRSTAFGEPLRVSVSRKSQEQFDSAGASGDFRKSSYDSISDNTISRGFSTVGRGRGMLAKREIKAPSFTMKPIILTDIKLKPKELINVEIIDLSNLECICARPMKTTENSKVEIADNLIKVNASGENLRLVNDPKDGECYLGKWDDGQYYRVELIEILNDGRYKVSFVDEGTSGDIITDLRQIPDGPLQQYPKQFTKISLGCKNSEDLQNYIINESDGKQVSLFWLGELYNKIPLVNLFLGDDEIIEKYIQINKVQIRDSFTIKFKDLPNHRSDMDCSNVTFIQSMYKSQSDFTVQIKEPTTILCQRRTPLVLPTPGDVCIYEKRNGVNNVSYLRCAVKRRQLFSFDILLFDSGENLNNVSIDCLYALDDSHKSVPPFTIVCELDKNLGYNEDTFQKVMCDENLKFSIISYKGNNRYVVAATVIKKEISHYPNVMVTKFIGQSTKVLVSHLVSPINFFVQIDKSEYIQTLNDIHEKLNISYNAARFVSADCIKVSQAVVAPFSVDGGIGENFRATVLEKRVQAPQIHVFYIDYGNDGWVDYRQLFDVDEDIISRPGLALNCTLNVDIRKEAWNHAIELFSRLVGFTDNDCCELVMQVMSACDGGVEKLVVDLTSLIKGSITMALDKSGTCFMKDDGVVLGKGQSVNKPLCNGDAKPAPTKVESPRPRQGLDTAVTVVHTPSSQATSKTDDYDWLVKKVNNLEQRLAILEKITYK